MASTPNNPSNCPSRSFLISVPDEEIQNRLKKVKHLQKERKPALARYAALVTSADKGAVLKLPEEM